LLAINTKNKGYSAQSPGDINSTIGNNSRDFSSAPPYTEMNLCSIHLHKNAEHKGGFTKYAGNGVGHGHGHHSGYMFSGHLTKAETVHID
jgi:hypothetical protein